jgi:hypothetical protein
MTSQEKWASGILASAVLSAVLTPIITPFVTELRDRYWCPVCHAWKVVGADGHRYCPNGHVPTLAMPYHVADPDIPEVYLSGYPWG